MNYFILLQGLIGFVGVLCHYVLFIATQVIIKINNIFIVALHLSHQNVYNENNSMRHYEYPHTNLYVTNLNSFMCHVFTT